MALTTEELSIRLIEKFGMDSPCSIPVETDLLAIANGLGYSVIYDSAMSSTEAGSFDEATGSLVLNPHLRLEDQRFVLAKLIGSTFSEVGDEANFARVLLMPSAIVYKYWAEAKSPRKIRKKFGVSEAQLAMRLSELKLI